MCVAVTDPDGSLDPCVIQSEFSTIYVIFGTLSFLLDAVAIILGR